MARSLGSLLLLAIAALIISQLSNAFLPAPQVVARTEMQQAQKAVVAAGLTAAAMPMPALAARVEEEDEGFDLRILAVLALPLFAVSWALFNVPKPRAQQNVHMRCGVWPSAKWCALARAPRWGSVSSHLLSWSGQPPLSRLRLFTAASSCGLCHRSS